MENGNKKRGRKPKHHITENGDPIKGLAYDKKSDRWRIIEGNRFFRAASEQEAVKKFYELTGQVESKFEQSLRYREFPMTKGRMVEWARSLILDTPQLAAQTLGIEWLAYGSQLPPPEKLPTLDELEKQWSDHAECGNAQRKKALRAWKEFRTNTGIVGLKDITAETAIGYKDDVRARGLSKKQQKHLFNGALQAPALSLNSPAYRRL